MSRHRVLLAAFLLVVATVTVRLPLLVQHQAIDDEVNYSVVTHELMHGGALYLDVVERRLPATFWVYRGVFRFFGPDNWFALHAFSVVWVLWTMLALHVLASRMFGARSGLLAALLYGVFQPWWYWGNLAFNGEVLMNLPIAWAIALCVGGRTTPVRCAAAGAAVAFAFLLKQPAAVAIVPLALYVLHPARSNGHESLRSRTADLAWIAGGASAVLLATALSLREQGILREAFYWGILDHDVPHLFWDKAIERTLAFLAVLLPIIGATVWSLRHPDGWPRHRAERDALLCLLAVSVVGAAASGRFYPHYYIGLIPALAVLASPAAEIFSAARQHGRASRLATIGIIWLVVAATATLVNQWIVGARQPQDTAVGRYIREHSDDDARLFVWGRTPRLYLDSDRRPAARYIDTFPLTGRIFGPRLDGVDTTSRILPGAWDHLRDDFTVHPPTFIVDTQTGTDAEYPVSRFPWLAELLRNRYLEVASVTEGTVYRRKVQPELRTP